mgnify:CR=1 FL=1
MLKTPILLGREQNLGVGQAVAPHHRRVQGLAWLRPIDSEHSAIWQCLVGEPIAAVARLVLTASGGGPAASAAFPA